MNGQSQYPSLSKLEEEDEEWWRDVERTREKRGALASLRKWREREKEREGDWHIAGERKECVTDGAANGGGVLVLVVGWAG